MCTYATESVAITGAARRGEGWFDVTTASVYFDHPVHARPEHTLNIDFINAALGASARAAVELDPESARALAQAILRVLDSFAPMEQAAPDDQGRLASSV